MVFIATLSTKEDFWQKKSEPKNFHEETQPLPQSCEKKEKEGRDNGGRGLGGETRKVRDSWRALEERK